MDAASLFGPTFEKRENVLSLILFQNRSEIKKKKKIAKLYKASDPVSNKFLLGILYPISGADYRLLPISDRK